jgi:hypothetical protein
MGEAGADAFTITRLMGHSNVTVSRRYVHPSPEAVELAFERSTVLNMQKVELESGIPRKPESLELEWVFFSKCPGGEIGRRNGLKIRFPATGVRVQFPPRAPATSA